MRCNWANRSPLEQIYHDHEWGIACHDDQALFEALVLEIMQAGLSWTTILKKREALREHFDHFDIDKVAAYQASHVEQLMESPAVIRHRLKIQAVITNAKAIQQLQKKFGSFDAYLWATVQGQVVMNHWQTLSQVPSSSDLSKALCKDMKQYGFTFIGNKTIYAFLQAIGIINDHLETCPVKYASTPRIF